MRSRILLPSTLAMLPMLAGAQMPRLWGMTPMGGANNKGTIYHIDADGTDFTKVFDFTDASGWGPEGELCLAPDGKLYGMTNLGGEGSPAVGTLFSYDPGGGGFTKLLDLNITNGGSGWAGFTLGGDGLLYGATYSGGGSGGSICSLDPATGIYAILHALDATTDGGSITDRLYSASDGLFYGTCATGGANNHGTLFRFDPATQAFTKLYDLTGEAGGRTPYGGLCESSGGWFYGATFAGGLNNNGVVYKYHPADGLFVKLLDLDTVPGNNCWARMVDIGGDQLVGTTALGGSTAGGLIFGIDAATDAFTERFSFNLLNGGTLFAGLVMGTDGQLYGAGASGGTNYQGTVYRFDPATNAMTTLHSFLDTTDGYSPRGGLVVAGMAVGIDEPTSTELFHVFPNPTDGEITLVSSAPINGGADLRVTDALGRTVRRFTLRDERTTMQLDLAPGTYTLTLDTPAGRRVRPVTVR